MSIPDDVARKFQTLLCHLRQQGQARRCIEVERKRAARGRGQATARDEIASPASPSIP